MERLGPGPRKAAAACCVRAVLWERVWKSCKRRTLHFSVYKGQNANCLALLKQERSSQAHEAKISTACLEQSNAVECDGTLRENTSSTARQIWLWIITHSWPTLGLCSLPHFWASHPKAAWQGLLCAAALRQCQAAGPVCGSSRQRCRRRCRQQTSAPQDSLSLAALNLITFGCLRDIWPAS